MSYHLAWDIMGVAGELPAPVPSGVDLAGVDVIVADTALLPGAARALAGERRLALVVLAEDEGPAAELRGLPLIGWGIVSPEATAAELHAAVLAAAQGMIVVPLPLVDRLLGRQGGRGAGRPAGRAADGPRARDAGSSEPGPQTPLFKGVDSSSIRSR